MTDAQRERLPEVLRDIVDFDRELATHRHALSRLPVVPIETGHFLRERLAVGESLRAAARHLYGRVPLRGDTGPGRPTAAAA